MRYINKVIIIIIIIIMIIIYRLKFLLTFHLESATQTTIIRSLCKKILHNIRTTLQPRKGSKNRVYSKFEK